MKASTVIATVASVAGVSAQRPSNTSICDYYTTALLKTNNATTQQTLLTLLVNTVVIGNYTQPNHNAVPGILAPGTYNGVPVNLLPYFNGMLASSNRGGSSGVSVNFLDGGAATPLKANMPANDMTSNQYKLLTHLYQFFAGLLGCSEYGNTSGQYQGVPSQYAVHKFMALNSSEVGYFIQQVGLAALSFGVTQDDANAAGMALTAAFDMRCAPAVAIPATASPSLQAICIASDCAVSPNATCAAYSAVITPTLVSTSPATSTPSGTASSTPSSTVVPGKSGAMGSFPIIPVVGSFGAAVLGAIVFYL